MKFEVNEDGVKATAFFGDQIYRGTRFIEIALEEELKFCSLEAKWAVTHAVREYLINRGCTSRGFYKLTWDEYQYILSNIYDDLKYKLER